MNEKPLRFFVVPVLSLAVLFLLGCGGSGSQARTVQPATGYGPATLEINNVSNEPIFYIYMSPSAQGTWGPDLLGANVLYVGQTFTITNVSPGYWDVRIVDQSGNYKEFYNEFFDAGGAYWIDVSSENWYY